MLNIHINRNQLQNQHRNLPILILSNICLFWSSVSEWIKDIKISPYKQLHWYWNSTRVLQVKQPGNATGIIQRQSWENWSVSTPNTICGRVKFPHKLKHLCGNHQDIKKAACSLSTKTYQHKYIWKTRNRCKTHWC